jgi:uncharacterized repeat protein (TIGR01451 family)
LTNPNANAVTGVAFSDSYSSDIVNATAPGAYSSCGGVVTALPNDNKLTLNGGTIPAGGSCEVSVFVTSSTISSGAGWANTLGAVTSSNAGTTATPATAYLTVISLAKPAAAKSFADTPLLLGASTALTVTITNPNSQPILGANFTDTYPIQIVNTALPGGATTCPGGTVSATGGGGTLGLNNATIPANSSCTVTVNVTCSVLGTWTNTISKIASANAADADPASANLTVQGTPSLTIVKSSAPDKAKPGEVIAYTVIIANTGTGPAATVVVRDDMSPYLTLRPDPFGNGTPFRFTGAGSGVTPDLANFSMAPNGAWQLPMTGSMQAGANFTLEYQATVK